MIRNVLNIQESALFDTRWQFVIDADDLTTTTASTAQAINLIPLAIGDIVRYVVTYLKTPMKRTGDTAFNTLGLTVGDTATAANEFITTQELNANGSFVTVSVSTNTVIYTAADNLKATFTPTSGKPVSTIDVGELYIYAVILSPARLSLARSALPITTKS